jgi:rod shape-determining protein MreC
MRRFNIIALLVFLGALVWVFTWKTPAAIAAKTRVMNVFSPFIRTGASVQRGVGALAQPKQSPSQLLAENTELKLEADRQRIMTEEYDRVLKENNEFRRMLDFARSHPLKLTTARILTRNSATYWSSATLDRGMNDELAPDLAVRTAEGLVGKLVHLWRRESEVLFITDESCKVAVKIEGSPDQGILSGVRGVSGRSPQLRITYLPRDANVPVGAKVYTSGKGTVFPSGILVGEVTKFLSLDDGGEALVRPAVDFDRLRYVFIIDRGEPETVETKRAGEVGKTR